MKQALFCTLALVSAAPVYAGEMTISCSTLVANSTENLYIRRSSVSHGSFSKGFGPANYNDRSSRGQLKLGSVLTGIEGSVEIINSKQEPVGTLYFDNPFIGSAECRVDWAPGYYGPCTWETEGAFGMGMVVKLEVFRDIQKPVWIPIPAIGAGVIRGQVRWDSQKLQPAMGQTYASAVQQIFTLSAGAPAQFVAQDPKLSPKESYQGRVGVFTGVQQKVGRFHWVSASDTGAVFELRDLPTDAPLYLQLTRSASPSTLYKAGSGNPPPTALELIPPGKCQPQFTVNLEAASAFRGPLNAAAPRYEGYDITLVGSWESESGDGSGGISVDPATAKLRAAALSRVNPNPLGIRNRATETMKVEQLNKAQTLGGKLGTVKQKGKIK